MRVLVTGGSGFIGSHIVEALLAAGVQVRALDLRGPTVSDDAKAHLDRRLEVVRGDLRQPEVISRAVRGIDAVCHQAAKVGLGVSFCDVGEYVTNNDLGTAVLLEGLWRRGFTGRLVLASSMVVYGEGRALCADHGEVVPPVRLQQDLEAERFEPRCPRLRCDRVLRWLPMSEDAALEPRNIYAATKLHQEHLCQVWGNEAGATVVALRYHNVYGPGMPRNTAYAGVASVFCSSLMSGCRPQVFEDGRQTRDFVHVRDIARANVIALTSPKIESGAYNVASGIPRTVGELAVALANAFGPDAPAPEVTGRWRLGDVRHVVASPTKATERLGFTAKVDLASGMAEVADAQRRADASW